MDDSTVVGIKDDKTPVTLSMYRNYDLYQKTLVVLNEDLKAEVLQVVPDKILQISEIELERIKTASYQQGLRDAH